METQEKHACWKIIACLIIQKVLFETQNDQNWQYQYYCIKNLLSVMLLVLAFLGSFWLIRYKSIHKKNIMQPAESHRDFLFWTVTTMEQIFICMFMLDETYVALSDPDSMKFQQWLGPFHMVWRTTMLANGFQKIFKECWHTYCSWKIF